MVDVARQHVRFEPLGRTVEARPGETIAQVAARAGIDLVSACGGLGICAGCRVITVGEADAEASRARLTAAQLARGERLACATLVERDLAVTLPADLGAGARKSEAPAKAIDVLWPSGTARGPIDAGSVAMLVLGSERDLAIELVQLKTGRVLFEVRAPRAPDDGWDALTALARESLRSHGFEAEQVRVALVLASPADRVLGRERGGESVESLGAHWRRAADVGFPAHPDAAVARLAAGSTGPSFVALGALAAFERGAARYVQLGGAPDWGGRDSLWLVADRSGHWAATHVESPDAWPVADRRSVVREAFGLVATDRAARPQLFVGISGAAPSMGERALLGDWLEEIPPSTVHFLGDGRLAGLHALLTSRTARVSWEAHDPILHVDALVGRRPPRAERVLSSE